jgi:signal transduction histidine kinase
MESPKNPSGLLAVSFSSGALITSVSPDIENLIGYAGCELTGLPVTRILADRSVFKMPDILNAASQRGSWEGDVEYLKRGGGAVKASGTVIPLSDSGNIPAGFLLLSKLKDPARPDSGDGSIYTEVGSQLRSFAHDLNNPLAVIMGFTQLLVLNTGCTGKVRSDIEKLYSELERVIEVVDNLHGYAVSLCEKASGSTDSKPSVRHSA